MKSMGGKNGLKKLMSLVLLGAVFAVSRFFASCDDAKDQSETGNHQTESSEESDGGQDDSNADATVVVLDAGHGGIDPGKVGVDGQLEKDINLQITLKLKELLENDKELNVKVVLTRSDDTGNYSDSDTNKKVADMKKRCEIINGSGAKLLVSIHQNSYHSTSVQGAQVFYYKDSQDGKILANTIQNKLVQELADSGKGRVEKANDNYYILLNAKCPAVIVECGFLSNPEEARALAQDDYQDRVAGAIAEGIKEYLHK